MRGNNALLCLLASAIGFFSTQSVYSLPADALSPNAASTAPSASVSSSDDNSLQEIVVTATRREAALQDVPITVSAFTGEVLQNYHIESTTDLMELVPNLTISSQVGAMVVYIRGVGQLATNAGQEPAVATYI